VNNTCSIPPVLGAALLALSLCFHPARAATTTVYRCLDAHLNVVYTDVKCKEGESFEIQTGEADAAALARLDRQRDALDRSADERLRAERLADAQRFVAVPMASETGADDSSGYGGYYTYPVAGYGPAFHHHPLRPKVVHHALQRGGAPPPPYVVPRR
jgi:hypothetical protein